MDLPRIYFMKIKVNDNVKVLSGRDAGKTGKVLQVLVRKASGETYMVVEGVNLRKKHLRPKSANDKGQTIELAAPLHMSNLMLIDPGSKKPTRVGYKIDGGIKKRIAKRTGGMID